MNAITSVRDEARTARQLVDLLEASDAGLRDVEVTMLPSPVGTGFSSETLLFDAAATVDGRRVVLPCVARLVPVEYTLFLEHDLESQWRVIDALHRTSDVPVPRIIAHDAIDGSWLGQRCYVMERITGRPAADVPPYPVVGWLKDASLTDQRAVYLRSIDVLAAIQAVDWRAAGLDFLLDSTANPAGLEPQHLHDERLLAWVANGRSFPAFERALAWLEANRPAHEGPLALSWGDARFGNVLYRDLRPVAVLDWEMVSLSSPVADLAWWLTFDRILSHGQARTRLPGFPTEDEVIERWEQLTGLTVTNLRFYSVRAALRAGVLLARFTDALIAAGQIPAAGPKFPHSAAVAVLEQLLDD